MVRLHRHDNPAGGILEEAAGHDLVIIGSRLSPSSPNVVVGRGLLRMVRRPDCPVVMVRPKHLAQAEPAYPIARKGYKALKPRGKIPTLKRAVKKRPRG